MICRLNIWTNCRQAQHIQELEASLAECRLAAEQQLQVAQADYEQRAAALNSQIESLKAEIAGIEAK